MTNKNATYAVMCSHAALKVLVCSLVIWPETGLSGSKPSILQGLPLIVTACTNGKVLTCWGPFVTLSQLQTFKGRFRPH